MMENRFSQENTANDRRGIETYKSSRHLVKLASSQIGTYLTSIRHPIIFVIIFSIQLINNCYQVHSEYVVVYLGKQRNQSEIMLLCIKVNNEAITQAVVLTIRQLLKKNGKL